MISERELRQLAGAQGVDPMILDLDYVLGCFLSQLYRDPEAGRLRFKGGTALKKCYFGDYRFSEDLDFSCETPLDGKEVDRLIERTARRLRDTFALDLGVQDRRIEVRTDARGSESVRARFYYRGPLVRTGAPRAIRLDLTNGEWLASEREERLILHGYSDVDQVGATTVQCYALPEILAEKIRALCGQRRYAISRDVYDVYYLVEQADVSLEAVKPLLPPKFAARGLDLKSISATTLEIREEEFRLDWDRNLMHLVPGGVGPQFEDAWQAVLNSMHALSGEQRS